MTQYRIIKGMFDNGELWYSPQRKVLFFWVDLDRGHYSTNRYPSLLMARRAIEQRKKYDNHKKEIIPVRD